MHGFSVPDKKGKLRKVILMAFIDDATRRILYAKFHFTEKSLIFEEGIKHILKAHGKIGRLYVDNGSSFVSTQTKKILETLVIYITHSKPYQPQGRGKIERFFRTVRQSFLRLQDPQTILRELTPSKQDYFTADSFKDRSKLSCLFQPFLFPHKNSGFAYVEFPLV